MDRATAYEAVGRVFESPRAHHSAYISALLSSLNLSYVQPQAHDDQPDRDQRQRQAHAPVVAFRQGMFAGVIVLARRVKTRLQVGLNFREIGGMQGDTRFGQ